MHPLFQRLRELDWDTFQRLSFQLISARHPGIGIRHVEGAGGDSGLDLFAGNLDSQPTIWQCKYFPNGLGVRQRPQVLDSLRTAVESFHPSTWILVVPLDLDAKGHQWFQKLQQSYKGKTALGLFTASDFVRELIHRRSLREAFFQGAIFDALAIKNALAGIADGGAGELEKLATENLDAMIARLEAIDARFNYQITYGPNVGPEIARQRPLNPRLLATVVDDKKKIEIFARDSDAIKLDPPTVKFRVSGSGARKLKEFSRTGRPQELSADEVSFVQSTFDFLLPEGGIQGWNLVVLPPNNLTQRRPKIRLIFENNCASIQYEYVEFKLIRAGTDEIEMESTSALPFVINIQFSLRQPFRGKVHISDRLVGAEVRSVEKALRAFSLLRENGRLLIHDLEQGKLLGTIAVSSTSFTPNEPLTKLVSGLVSIATKFGIQVLLPEKINRNDREQISFLLTIVNGAPLPGGTLSATLIRDRAYNQSLLTQPGLRLDLLAKFPKMEPAPMLFGVPINTGPITLSAKGASVVNRTGLKRQYDHARSGTELKVKFEAQEIRAELGEIDKQGFYARPEVPEE